MTRPSKNTPPQAGSLIANAELIARFKQDDHNAFASLVKQHTPEIERVLRKTFSNAKGVDIDDVVQITWLKAWEARETFKEGSLLAWLRKIARNTALTSIKRAKSDPGYHRDPNQLKVDNHGNENRHISKKALAVREIVASFPKPSDREIIRAYQESPERYSQIVRMKHDMKASHIRKRKKELFDQIRDKLSKSGFNISDTEEGPGSLQEIFKRLAPVIERATTALVKPGRARTLSDDELRGIVSGVGSVDGEHSRAIAKTRMSTFHPPRYVSTGFPALDTLLGGNGFVQGASILIRGQPGTGKTTLALQIAKNAIEQNHTLVFASVEDEPEILLNQITQSFWDKSYEDFLEKPDRWHVRDFTAYFDRDVTQDAREKTIDQWCREAGLTKNQRQSISSNPKAVERLIGHLLLQDESRAAVRRTLREMDVDALLTRLWNELPVDTAESVILVVDSLNALINSAAARFRSEPERQMLVAVLNSFRNWRRSRRGNVTVIFLLEEDSRIVNSAASYLADVVIDLRKSDVEQTIYETPDQPKKWQQEMRFCKIQKGRGLPIQGRSCCYEFAKGPNPNDCGIVFLPTYAAPGVVSLFHENAPMLEVISTLRTNDVPALFPQVLVQEFNRAALQRVFSLSRRRTRISLRHPMMLSNVDEYWLKRLRQDDLLQPIPASKLTVFSLQLNGSSQTEGSRSFIKELVDTKESIFAEKNDKGEMVYFGVPQIANIGVLVYRKDVLSAINEQPPETWEDVERICIALRPRIDLPNKIAMELTSYDTFLATALELGWGHGAFWRTIQKADELSIKFDDESDVVYLIAALIRIKHWIFSLQILPEQCSVDPEVNPSQDWVFARHWYSTWVNVCTHERSRDIVKKGKYGIWPIPISADYKRRMNDNARHHSAWGEWYLALLRGSENIELGAELINNLMTARKITERARNGAALPTAERFYEITDEHCPETDFSYKQLRERFFTHAKSRSEFDDYPRFARMFAAVLRTVATNRNADVIDAVRRGFLNIDAEFPWPTNIQQRLIEILPKEMHRHCGQNSQTNKSV